MGTVAALAAGLALAARAIAARHLRLPGRLASRPGTRVAMAALLLASAASPQPAAAPPPGVPNFAVLRAVEGAPDDSASAREFWAAFRGAFTGPSFATERPEARPGAPALSIPISNRFALLEGQASDSSAGVYGVQLSIEWLKPGSPRSTAHADRRDRALVRAKRSRPGAKPARAPIDTASAAAGLEARRAVVSVLVWPPGVDPAIVRIAPARDTVTFLAPPEPLAARARSIGRNVALLALERLHHASGDLASDERLKLDHAERRAATPAIRGPHR